MEESGTVLKVLGAAVVVTADNRRSMVTAEAGMVLEVSEESVDVVVGLDSAATAPVTKLEVFGVTTTSFCDSVVPSNPLRIANNLPMVRFCNTWSGDT